jgi:hypothetical protein
MGVPSAPPSMVIHIPLGIGAAQAAQVAHPAQVAQDAHPAQVAQAAQVAQVAQAAQAAHILITLIIQSLSALLPNEGVTVAGCSGCSGCITSDHPDPRYA